MALLLSCAQSIPTKPTQAPEIEVPYRVNFDAKSSLKWPHETAKAANCVTNDKEFIDALRSIEKFDYSDDTGIDVYNKLMEIKATIRTYKTKNPFSKAIATTYKSNKSDVYFNRRKNPRPMQFMVNTACHERTHLGGYSHGTNSSKGKENSIPYFIGSLCQKYYLKNCADKLQ